VTLDANILVALVLPLPFSVRATAKMVEWNRKATELLAPQLFEYEVSSALRKATALGTITDQRAASALSEILALQIRCVPPTWELHERALHWAKRLAQHKTCDAHYLAVAEKEEAYLWTADRRLANAARQAGVVWVHWIGDGEIVND
jgi:predicted nucleic acid-binding protein